MHVLNYDETYIFSTQHILFCVISAFVGQASGKKGSSSLGTVNRHYVSALRARLK